MLRNSVPFTLALVYTFRSVTSGLRAPTSACLWRGLRDDFSSECCTGGEPMAASHVNRFLASIYSELSTRWPDRKYCFSSLSYDQTRNRILPAFVARLSQLYHLAGLEKLLGVFHCIWCSRSTLPSILKLFRNFACVC